MPIDPYRDDRLKLRAVEQYVTKANERLEEWCDQDHDYRTADALLLGQTAGDALRPALLLVRQAIKSLPRLEK